MVSGIKPLRLKKIEKYEHTPLPSVRYESLQKLKSSRHARLGDEPLVQQPSLVAMISKKKLPSNGRQ
jgi:hypothetical protein